MSASVSSSLMNVNSHSAPRSSSIGSSVTTSATTWTNRRFADASPVSSSITNSQTQQALSSMASGLVSNISGATPYAAAPTSTATATSASTTATSSAVMTSNPPILNWRPLGWCGTQTISKMTQTTTDYAMPAHTTRHRSARHLRHNFRTYFCLNNLQRNFVKA